MWNYKITVQYDGTDYHGWQMQSNARTVQGELTRVVSLLDHRPVTIHGAGRTDAGVHAEGQVASFLLERRFEPRALSDAINANLDRDLRVFEAQLVDDSFHARFSARMKTYRYQIWTGDFVPPFIHRYVHHHRGTLDVAAMREGASHLVGHYDFSAFTLLNSEFESHIRTLKRLDVEQDGHLILIHAASEGFLRYMVRTIVGTLVQVGRGKVSPGALLDILESRDRARAGATAPAAGLTLVRVDY